MPNAPTENRDELTAFRIGIPPPIPKNPDSKPVRKPIATSRTAICGLDADGRITVAAPTTQHRRRDHNHHDGEGQQELAAVHSLADRRADERAEYTRSRKHRRGHLTVLARVLEQAGEIVDRDRKRTGANGDMRIGDPDHVNQQGTARIKRRRVAEYRPALFRFRGDR